MVGSEGYSGGKLKCVQSLWTIYLKKKKRKKSQLLLEIKWQYKQWVIKTQKCTKIGLEIRTLKQEMTPGNLLCFHSVVQRCLQGRLAHSAAYTHQSANLSSFKSCHEKTLWLHLHRWRVQSCIHDVYTPVFYVYVLMTCTLLCWWRNLSCVTGVYIHVLMVCTLWQVWVCAFGCCFVSANGLLVDVCQCCCLLMFVCLPLSRHFPWIWIWTDITFWDGIIPQAAEINMWRYKNIYL